MEYISVKEASALWNIDTSNIGKLCRKGKIEGAKIVGRSWLIPKNAVKPIDGRTRTAKEKQNPLPFRFPLYINFPEDSFVPPLSEEEQKLRTAQADFYACEFKKAKPVFEELSVSAENIYVKICALFFMCVLSAVYDTSINWSLYYCSLNHLLSTDFPHKKEMELFLPWLDFIIGQFNSIPEKLNTDSTYEYHNSALYMNALMSAFNHDENNTGAVNPQCTEPFETLCCLMERDGYYVEAQEMHMILLIYHYSAHNIEAMQYHLRKVVDIAYGHNLLFVATDAETYYADETNAVLCEYPDSFAQRISEKSQSIYGNFSRFAEISSKTSVYTKLSRNDYRYIFYAINGFTNKQVAGFCHLSERTVAKKYYDIYEKLGVGTKQEMLAEMSISFGKKS